MWCQLIEIAAILLAATEQLLSNNVCQTLVSRLNSDSKLQQHMGPEQPVSFKDREKRVLKFVNFIVPNLHSFLIYTLHILLDDH